MSFVGAKVVRGPSWSWGLQDGGEGHIGTIVETYNFPKRTVMVQWVDGFCSNYKIGFEDSYDLRIIDNSDLGILHTVPCNECLMEQIDGLRYSCISCNNYNLCRLCYHSGKHSLLHEFTFFVTPLSKGVRLTKRKGERQVKLQSGLHCYIAHLHVLGKQVNRIGTETEPNVDEILNRLLEEVHDLERERSPAETPVCLLCDKLAEENVTFLPCKHRLVCESCSSYVKKCFHCRVSVKRRVAPDGTYLPIIIKYKDRVEKMKKSLAEIEEKYACNICMERRFDTAFSCGHSACSKCIRNLNRKCHMCREPITLQIRI